MKVPDMISPRRFWFPMNKENMRIPLRRQNEGCLILNCQPERLFWVRWTFSPVGLVGRSLMNISMSLWNQSGRRGGVHRVLLYISHLINTRREDLVWRLSWRPKKKKKEKHTLHLLPDGGRINYICGAHKKKQQGVYPGKKLFWHWILHRAFNRYSNFLQLLNVLT